jgi:glycosyltransferase involved in cell wall biosynthesis
MGGINYDKQSPRPQAQAKNGKEVVSSDLNKVEWSGVTTIMFVATTPFAVNAFLANHISALSVNYRIILCTNLDAYKLNSVLLSSLEVHHIPFSRRISLFTDMNSLLKLTMLVCQVRPKVIHSITPKAGLLAMLAGFIARVPNRWHTFTGQVWVTKQGFARSALKACDRLIVLLASKVFADSASQCRLLRDEGVVRDGQIGMLGSGSIAGVDVKRFKPDNCFRERFRKKMNTDPNVCVFLFVGRLAKDKGVFDLIRVFRELSTLINNIELWVVGPDEEELLQNLQKFADDIRAPIRWHGATAAPEVYMKSADILLLPSYREGFGSVIIEAAACEMPAIAYRIDGVIDAIVDGVSGVLIKLGDTSSFVEVMRQLALNHERRQRLGYQAHERAVNEFSSEKVTNAWVTFYRSKLSHQHEAYY